MVCGKGRIKDPYSLPFGLLSLQVMCWPGKELQHLNLLISQGFQTYISITAFFLYLKHEYI